MLNMAAFRLRHQDEDKRRWVPSKRGKFDIRSFYNVLVPHDNTFLPWKSTWQNKVHLKVSFFAWTATLGKTLTIDNLRK
jgi:hypothetical protein